MNRWAKLWGPYASSFITLQITRPWAVLLVAIATTLPAAWAAQGLSLRTDFAELLPQNKPSVVEMRRVSAKLTSASTLTVVAEVSAPNPRALSAFAEAVAPRIQQLGPEQVGRVDDGTQAQRAFLQEHKLLYAPLSDLEQAHDELRTRYDREVERRTSPDLEDTDPLPPINAKALRARFAKAEEVLDKQGGGGHYIGEEGKLLAILVHTPFEPGSSDSSRAFREKIDRIVEEVNPRSFDPTMVVRYTGDFITSVEEYDSVKNDLGHVGRYGLVMVLGAVFVFFLQVRTLLAMALTIAVGIAWTFGMTRLTIGYLNSSTGFLVSIIAGNGINFGIIYMARYLEARRHHQPPAEAVRTAHHDTWLATLAAAFAATLSYGSLAITDFRGFKHFGIIGGMGMILCWSATYLFLPALLVVTERFFPMRLRDGSIAARVHRAYGAGFAWLALRFSAPIVLVSVVTGVCALGLSVFYFASDPIEYDMTRLRNARRTPSMAGELSGRVDDIVGRLGQDGMAIMVDKLEQVEPLKAALNQRKDQASDAEKPFEQVVTIFDILPKDQDKKLPLLEDIRHVLLRAKAQGMVPTGDWKDIEPYVPAADIHPIGLADLPEQMARPFTDKDGVRGHIVYIAPKEGRSVWDAHYLKLWADSFRSVTLPNGEVVRGSGRAVIFADMIDAVVEDAPKAIAASLLGTILVVLLAFRQRGPRLAVLLTLLLGIVWMLSFLALRHMKLNFLNFVALPITFGIGVDYAVNIMQRYRLEGASRLREVVVETGGAVVLCSMTTMLGYLSLTLSMNQAIVTFGVAAAAGEIACILAAVLVLPAALARRSSPT